MVLPKSESQGSRFNLAVPIYEKNLVDNNPEPAEDRLSLLDFCRSRAYTDALLVAAFECLGLSKILWQRHSWRVLDWRHYLELGHLSGRTKSMAAFEKKKVTGRCLHEEVEQTPSRLTRRCYSLR